VPAQQNQSLLIYEYTSHHDHDIIHYIYIYI